MGSYRIQGNNNRIIIVTVAVKVILSVTGGEEME